MRNLAPEKMMVYRNIILHNHEYLLSGKEKLDYNLYRRSIGALGIFNGALFFGIMLLTTRIRKVKNGANKLYLGTILQFASIMALYKIGQKFEKVETDAVCKHLSDYSMEELNTFKIEEHMSKKKNQFETQMTPTFSGDVYNQQDNF